MTAQFPSSSTGQFVQVDMSAQDYTFVAAEVVINSSSSAAINDSSYGDVTVNGTVNGIYGVRIGDQSGVSHINIGASGVVGAFSGGYAVTAIRAVVVNRGSIQANGGGTVGVSLTGGSLVNYGTIDTSDPAANAVTTSNASIVNFGSINGGVQLTSVTTFDSSQGQVFGTITVASGAAKVVAGTNGNTVVGASGNDSLVANGSQAAADNRAQFRLDGRAGANALYGGGAFNTFLAGDAVGGHNHIIGGLSLMGDVAGYHNNTIDFSTTPGSKSVRIDLLTSHTAYLNQQHRDEHAGGHHPECTKCDRFNRQRYHPGR